jgi:hypothetical protein
MTSQFINKSSLQKYVKCMSAKNDRATIRIQNSTWLKLDATVKNVASGLIDGVVAAKSEEKEEDHYIRKCNVLEYIGKEENEISSTEIQFRMKKSNVRTMLRGLLASTPFTLRPRSPAEDKDVVDIIILHLLAACQENVRLGILAVTSRHESALSCDTIEKMEMIQNDIC